jgi:hypothetical protein
MLVLLIHVSYTNTLTLCVIISLNKEESYGVLSEPTQQEGQTLPL